MTLHTKLSFIKSGVRILGFASLVLNVGLGALILIVAEGIGVWEELAPNAYAGTAVAYDAKTIAAVKANTQLKEFVVPKPLPKYKVPVHPSIQN